MKQVARLAANADQFIEKQPDVYQTQLGEKGMCLSGGQQRIAIARAILKDLLIMLLDEATRGLDSENKLLLQKALEQIMKDHNDVIAHRSSTVVKAGCIVVMEAGRIVDIGQHQQLLQR